MLELAILGLLTDQPLHGYELKKQLADTLGLASGVSFGSLYPALGRLETAGAVVVAAPDGEGRGRRARKVYEITADGRRLFEELLAAESTANDDDKVFALRLAFARHLPPEARLGMLERRRARLAERLVRLGARVRAGVDRLDGYGRSLAEHDREAAANDLRWIDRLIASEHEARGAASPPPAPEGPSQLASPAPSIGSLRPPGHRAATRPTPGHTRPSGPAKRRAVAPAGARPTEQHSTDLKSNHTGEPPVDHLEDPTL